MELSLLLTLPDEVSPGEAAAYLMEMAESAAGQLEQAIIALPEVDEQIHIDAYSEDRSALLFRSS
jgi:hypothetical protein